MAAVEGGLFRISEAGMIPVSLGDPIVAGAVYRTAHGGGAQVKLEDGSVAEFDERTAFRFERSHRDMTIGVDRGAVIVEASDQGSGHLFVETPDCKVAVQGTVFAVRAGAKGSRVSVLEGEVHVDSQRGDDVLLPGDQVTTSEALETISLAEDIAWSANIERHLAMLAELKAIGAEIEAKVRVPGARYEHPLLDLVPPDTTVYVALPNLGETLADAHEILAERASKSAVLADWWKANVESPEAPVSLHDLMANVRLAGESVGDEIVLAFPWTPGRPFAGPIVLAQVRDEAKLLSILERIEAGLSKENARFAIHLHRDTPLTPSSTDALEVLLRDGIVAIAGTTDALRGLLPQLDDSSASSFESASFRESIDLAYRDGAQWLFAADIERIVAGVRAADDQGGSGQAVLEFLGLGDARHLMVEGLNDGRESAHRIELSFGEERRGVLSWLAEPGPMGALDFVSPDASFASGFTVKDPAALLRDDILSRLPEGTLAELRSAETGLGINLENDLARALGGEMAFAIDGALLPSPSWKLVLEVYDAELLQRSMVAITEAAGERVATEGVTPPRLTSAVVAGRTYYELALDDLAYSVHYTFVDGFLIMAPSRSLLDTAIANRARGYTLLTSASIRSKMPRDANAGFSGLLYENLSGSLAPLADRLRASGRLTTEQAALVEQLVSEGSSSLTWAYASRDRIEVAGSSDQGLLGLGAEFVLQGGGLAQLASLAAGPLDRTAP
ncbi:MAG: FecR domain-containing protein [Acidobacteria bacterium]|nr:FecR domain-containing protein [Acidobacteriota bacterium]